MIMKGLRGAPGICKAYDEMIRGRIKLAKREMSRADLLGTTVGKRRWKGISRGTGRQNSCREPDKNLSVRQARLAPKTDLRLDCICDECTEDVHSCLRAQCNLSLRELKNEGGNKIVLVLFTCASSIFSSDFATKETTLLKIIIIKHHNPLGFGTFSLIS